MFIDVSRNKIMPKFIILTMIIIFHIKQNETYLIKVDKSRSMNNGMESVFHKYLSSLKELSVTARVPHEFMKTYDLLRRDYKKNKRIKDRQNDCTMIGADLPNHNLELQIEMIEPAPPPVVPLRRMFRTYKQPKIRRSGDEGNIISHESKETTTRTSTVQNTTVYTSSIASTTVTPFPLPPNTPPGPQEKPVYMEDLQRALKEFEKKLSSIQISTGCNGNHPVQTVPFPAYTTLPSSTYIINRNIENIVELLRRGVHVETHVDQPSDENLDWLQIKIPKHI